MKLYSPTQLYKNDRPREKLLRKGVDALSDLELLQVIIGSGVKGANVAQVAYQVLQLLSGHGKKFSLKTLMRIKGMSVAKAGAIVAALEFAKRQLNSTYVSITKASDILPFVSSYAAKKQEYLICFSLNGAGGIIAERVVSVGTVSSTLIHPREVFAEPLSDHAAAVLLVHNHPSNIAEPSKEDLEMTSNLKQASQILGIQLLDHVIITPNRGYYSFCESGLV